MFGFLRKRVFTDNNLVRVHEADTWMKPVGSVFGSAGKILGAFGAVYAFKCAKDKMIEQKREAERRQLEHEMRMRQMRKNLMQRSEPRTDQRMDPRMEQFLREWEMFKKANGIDFKQNNGGR